MSQFFSDSGIGGVAVQVVAEHLSEGCEGIAGFVFSGEFHLGAEDLDGVIDEMGIDLILKRFQVRILLGGFLVDDILDQRIDLIQEDVETLGDGADFIGSFDGQPFIEIVVYDIVDFFDLMVDEPENLADIPIEVEDNHEETQGRQKKNDNQLPAHQQRALHR